MGALRAMIAGSEPTEPKTVTLATEPDEPVRAAPEPEAVQEPAEPKQEPTETDEPLPEGVQKRIAKEAEKAARIQSEIDRAVSTRKAKEKELADLTATGSQPAPTSATAEKKAPEFGEKGHENETYVQYQQRDREFLKAEIAAETRKSLEQEFTQRQQQDAAKVKWDAAIETEKTAGTIKDAKEFAALMAKAQEVAPEGLQAAISSLDNWSGVAVHLAKDPAKLAELATMFNANPYAAVARLGRIEASLKSASKPAAEPLPDPPAKQGGAASAATGALDLEKADMSQVRSIIAKVRKAG